jgi:hypothetical protein
MKILSALIAILLFATPAFAAKVDPLVKEVVAAVNEELRTYGCITPPPEVMGHKNFISASNPGSKNIYRTFPELYETKSATPSDVVEYSKKGGVLLIDGKRASVESFLNDPVTMKKAQWIVITPLGERLYEKGCGFRFFRPETSGTPTFLGKPDWKTVYLVVKLESKLVDNSPELHAAAKGRISKLASFTYTLEKNDKGKWSVSKIERND